MSETLAVFRLTDDAFRTLINEARNRPELWSDPDTDFAAVLTDSGVDEPLEKVEGVTALQPIHMEPPATGIAREADRQALDFHRNLRGMTQAKASDPQLWAWFNHFVLHAYGIARWPRRQSQDSTGHIRLHWLNENPGNLYESSIAGRTWWLAETCLKVERAGGRACDASQVLELFSGMAERYHYAMRFAFMRNPLIAAEYAGVLLNEAQGINSKGIRELVQSINHEAGVKLIDVLGRDQIRQLFIMHAEQAMMESRNVTDRRYLRGVSPLRVLSLGAGTQSTVLALMADQGYEGMPRPDFAIFADTRWEPPEVYAHLEWLKSQLSYEIVTVSAGDIKQDVLQGRNPRGGGFLDIPTYLTLPNGTAAIAKRQCTSDYKLDPICRELRKRLGLEPGRRAPKDKQAEVWLGISKDEEVRQKPSRHEWITNRWPLVEKGYSRAQLHQWFKERYPERELPRSACIGCPYRSNSEWKHLKERAPEAFAEAVEVDHALRSDPRLRSLSKGQAYLHRSRIPLEDVDFSNTMDYADQMMEECEGLCGI